MSAIQLRARIGAWAVKLLAGLALLAIVIGCSFLAGYDAARSTAKAKQHDTEREARSREQAILRVLTDRVYRITYEAKRREQENDAVLAGLRTGTVRMRERFTCTPVSSTTADPAGATDGAQRGLLPADAEFLVRFAAECDAIVDERNTGKAYAEAVTGK